MSLNVFLRKEDIPENMQLVIFNDAYFNASLYGGLIIDDEIKMIMRDIDKAEYTDSIDMRTRFGNIVSMESLSTGCKTVINIIRNTDKVFDCIECGCNVMTYLQKMKSGNILLRILPDDIDSVIDVNLIYDNRIKNFNDSSKFSSVCEELIRSM